MKKMSIRNPAMSAQSYDPDLHNRSLFYLKRISNHGHFRSLACTCRKKHDRFSQTITTDCSTTPIEMILWYAVCPGDSLRRIVQSQERNFFISTSRFSSNSARTFSADRHDHNSASALTEDSATSSSQETARLRFVSRQYECLRLTRL